MSTPPGDIVLNHQNVDDAATDLTKASADMIEAMEKCAADLAKAESLLQGQLLTEAVAFRTMLKGNESGMSSDINTAAGQLRLMHGLLRDADNQAARGIAS
ncbi:hypothetical protein [Kitasatospora sp. NPDC056181]|uniref:hypothetical protein n=1 Tax=Kitasatospora sp. NPDC056181 TaxID=3345737 RepID=UPI0035E03F4E